MSAESAARAPAAGVGRLSLALALGAGLAARIAAAGQFRAAAEWEADSFVWAWADPGTRSLSSGCRPAGLQASWELLGSVVPVGSIPGFRWASIVVSLLMLGCAWELSRTLLRWRGASALAIRQARFQLCLLWAVIPALVWAGARVVPEQVSGGALCLLAAAFVRYRMSASFGTWLWLCATGALSLAVGGIVVAVALTVGMLLFVLPLPRVSVALPVLGAWILALVAAFGLARWHDASRPWRPDCGPAYALSALVDAPVVFDDRESCLPEVRSDAVWRSAWETVRDRPVTATMADLAWRAQGLISPWRFADGASDAQAVLGIVDSLLTGGVLLLAVLAFSRRAALGAAPLPRVAVAAAALTLVGATIACATGPFALSGAVLIAIALASAAGPVEGSPQLPVLRTRFLAGGLLLTALALAPPPEARPASLWLAQLTDQIGQGRQAVALLSAGGPVNGPEELQLSQILMDPAAPFLRRPQLAREHALAALEQLPTDEEAVAVLVRAETDCLRFTEAEDLAKTLVDDSGTPSPRGRMLADWVRDKARRARLDGLP